MDRATEHNKYTIEGHLKTLPDDELRRIVLADEALASSEELLAYAGGTLSESEAMRIEKVLKTREDLELAVKAVRTQTEESSPRASLFRFRPSSTREFLAAAAALLMVLIPLSLEQNSTRPAEIANRTDGSWTGPDGQMRSGHGLEPRFEVLAPQGPVYSLRPEIVWCAGKENSQFELRVVSDDQTVLVQATTKELRLTWPFDAPDLKPGHQYQVIVRSVRGPRSSSRKWFTVLNQNRRDSIEQDLDRVPRKPSLSPSWRRARAFARTGARSDAVRELESEYLELTSVAREAQAHQLRELGAVDIVRNLELRYWIQFERNGSDEHSRTVPDPVNKPWLRSDPRDEDEEGK